MPDRSTGRSQTKWDTLVLQVGGLGVRLTTSHRKIKLFRNQTIRLGWRKDEEWRQIVQKAKAHPEL
jgi:hypothetical protein